MTSQSPPEDRYVDRYVVRSHLLHNGMPCIPGDTVPGSYFTADQAAYLVGCGTLEALPPEPAADTPVATTPRTKESRRGA